MRPEFSQKMGEITGYAIEIGDSVTTFERGEFAGIQISRQGNKVTISGRPPVRRFTVTYSFRISSHLPVSEEEIEQNLEDFSTEVNRDDIAKSLRKQKLKKLNDSDIEEAIEVVEDQIGLTDSTITTLYFSEDGELWDGFEATTALYPYDDPFGLREYNEAIVQVIADGRPIALKIYQEIKELGSEVVPSAPEPDSHHDRTYQ